MRRLLGSLLMIAASVGNAAIAAPQAAQPVPLTQRVVDQVLLNDNQRLLGMALGTTNTGDLQFVVRRDWLKQHAAATYRRTVADEPARDREILEQLVERLIAWRELRKDEQILANFLDQQLDQARARLKKLRAAVEEEPADKPQQQKPETTTQLLVLVIPANQIRRGQFQKPDARHILGLAWERELEEPEEQSRTRLVQKLEKLMVDVKSALPDLTDRIPSQPQDEQAWAARVAVVEYSILGKPHFQGAGGMLVRDDPGQQRPGLEELLTGMLGEGLESQLAELLGDGSKSGAARDTAQDEKSRQAVKKATAEAAEEGATGARITQLNQDIGRKRVSVTGQFWVRLDGGEWRAAWRQSAMVDASRADPKQQAELADDPQIKEITDMIKKLGLPLGQGALDLALQFGIATKQAQTQIDDAFSQFLLQATRRLDGPPITLLPAS